MAEKYKFYKHDGAYFRRLESAPGIGVREVLGSKGWEPYESDDHIAPVMFGSEIEESELPKEAAAA